MGTDDTLTAADIADKLRCSVKHVRKLMDAGRLAWFPFGLGTVRPRRRVTAAEFARFLADTTEKKERPVAGRRKLPAVPDYV